MPFKQPEHIWNNAQSGRVELIGICPPGGPGFQHEGCYGQDPRDLHPCNFGVRLTHSSTCKEVLARKAVWVLLHLAQKVSWTGSSASKDNGASTSSSLWRFRAIASLAGRIPHCHPGYGYCKALMLPAAKNPDLMKGMPGELVNVKQPHLATSCLGSALRHTKSPQKAQTNIDVRNDQMMDCWSDTTKEALIKRSCTCTYPKS